MHVHAYITSPHLRMPEVDYEDNPRLRGRRVSSLVDEGIVEHDTLSFFQVDFFPTDYEIGRRIIVCSKYYDQR